jgi:hypothetical protein
VLLRTERASLGSEDSMSRFLRPTIFDKFLRFTDADGQEGNVSVVWNTLSSFCYSGRTSEWMSRFAASSSHITYAQSLYNIFTRPSSVFFALPDENVPLYTPHPFQLGSSISHFDALLPASPGFMMGPLAHPGLTMNELLRYAKGDMANAMGYWTTQLLLRLGYNLKNGQKGERPTSFESKHVPQCSGL